MFGRWSDIIGFSRNRKLFGIDTSLSVKPFQFQLVSYGIFPVFVVTHTYTYRY